MKTLTFYEVNEATGSMVLFDHFPRENGVRQVFDIINDRGAVTLRQLKLELSDFSGEAVLQALTELRRLKLITRRSLVAAEED